MKSINFISQHWPEITAGVLFVISVLNAITKHFSEHKGLVKVLTFISEMLSFLTSKEALASGIAFKFPLQSVKPGGGGGGNDRLKMAVLLLFISASSGCSHNTAALKSLSIAHQVTAASFKIALNACRPTLKECIRNHENPCQKLLACQSKRKPVLQALHSAETSILIGVEAVKATDKDTQAQAVESALGSARLVCHAISQWVSIEKIPITLQKMCAILGGI